MPWLETFAPRSARAAGGPIRRYVSLFFCCGTPHFWWPQAAGPLGTGGASAILEPLSPSNKSLLVLGGVGNYSATGNAHAEPSHGSACSSAWHCYDPRQFRLSVTGIGGGISVDQVIANQIGSFTPLPSIQLGLSTLDSYCDGTPCAHSRSISWAGPGLPLYKTINPQAVFDVLVTAAAPGAALPANTNMTDPQLAQTRALKKSVLDSVLDSAASLRGRVSVSDRARIDQYLWSVRALERLVAAPAMQVTGSAPALSCASMTRPPEPYADMSTPPDYSRETHSNLMIQLVAMALSCDLTRVVSFMLDDERSDFVYDHVPVRRFYNPDPGMLSSPGVGVCAGYHGSQHCDNDWFSSITWWMASKANQLAQALAALPDGTGTSSVMDNTVIHFGSGMNGGNHDGLNLPICLIGGAGGVLKTGQYLQLTGDAPGGGARLANLHLTLIQKVFGGADTSFGTTGASTGILPEILA